MRASQASQLTGVVHMVELPDGQVLREAIIEKYQEPVNRNEKKVNKYPRPFTGMPCIEVTSGRLGSSSTGAGDDDDFQSSPDNDDVSCSHLTSRYLCSIDQSAHWQPHKS